jgi:cobalamin biosynthesis Mg chelatase CobN
MATTPTNLDIDIMMAAKYQQMISRNWWWLTNLKKILYKSVVIMQEMNGIIDGCKISTDDISKLQLTHRKMSNHLENLENLKLRP